MPCSIDFALSEHWFNDSVSIYIGMGKSSGEAAAFSHPPSPANARHFNRREKSPQKHILCTRKEKSHKNFNPIFYS